MSIIKLNNNGVKNATAFGSITGLGSMVFIKKLTASSSSTLSFVDGSSGVTLDNSYKEYLFTFNNMHPATDNADFRFQANKSGGSGYNETITSNTFQAYHEEGGSSAVLQYRTDYDQAQGTGFQIIANTCGNGNDESISGYLHIFNPSSTTSVKHFIARTNTYYYGDITIDLYSSGYFNETDAIDEFQFKFSTGNIDAGDICLYGIA